MNGGLSRRWSRRASRMTGATSRSHQQETWMTGCRDHPWSHRQVGRHCGSPRDHPWSHRQIGRHCGSPRDRPRGHRQGAAHAAMQSRSGRPRPRANASRSSRCRLAHGSCSGGRRRHGGRRRKLMQARAGIQHKTDNRDHKECDHNVFHPSVRISDPRLTW